LVVLLEGNLGRLAACLLALTFLFLAAAPEAFLAATLITSCWLLCGNTNLRINTGALFPADAFFLLLLLLLTFLLLLLLGLVVTGRTAPTGSLLATAAGGYGGAGRRRCRIHNNWRRSRQGHWRRLSSGLRRGRCGGGGVGWFGGRRRSWRRLLLLFLFLWVLRQRHCAQHQNGQKNNRAKFQC